MTVFNKGLVSLVLTLSAWASGSNAMANTATAGSAPDCSDPTKFEPNSWLLLVNESDNADRDSLLALMRSLSTGGFSVLGIYPGGAEIETFVVVTRFDASYYGNEQIAHAARDRALQGLAKANGVSIYCNGRIIPFPGITIRN